MNKLALRESGTVPVLSTSAKSADQLTSARLRYLAAPETACFIGVWALPAEAVPADAAELKLGAFLKIRGGGIGAQTGPHRPWGTFTIRSARPRALRAASPRGAAD